MSVKYSNEQFKEMQDELVQFMGKTISGFRLAPFNDEYILIIHFKDIDKDLYVPTNIGVERK